MADEALSGDGVTIWFAPAGVLGSELADDAAEFQSFVTSFDESGGERDTESIVVMGGGNITKQKPQTQKELSFDVVLRHSARIGDFKKIERGDVISADGAGADFVVGAVIIQQSNGSDHYYQAYNNVNAVVFDTEFAAEDEWRGTLTLKLSPTTPTGVPNIKAEAANVTTDLTVWS